MARVLAACCDRCGAVRGAGEWTESSGVPMHLCPDGFTGGEGSFDVKYPESRPKIVGLTPADIRGCPNCQRDMILHAKGYPACLSCGTYEVEPNTFLVPFGNWVNAGDSVGRSFLMAIQAEARDVSHVLVDKHGGFLSHQLTTAAEEVRRQGENFMKGSQMTKMAAVVVALANSGAPIDYAKLTEEFSK